MGGWMDGRMDGWTCFVAKNNRFLERKQNVPTQFQMSRGISFFTPQPLRAPGYCRTPSGRAGGRQGRQAPLTLSRP